MSTLILKLEKQLLTKLNYEVIASGDDNVDTCQFEFDDYWNGYVKTAVFYQTKDKTHFALLDNDDKCFIPVDAMAKAGRLHIGVFGMQSGNVVTSTMEHIEIHEGAISSDNISTEPSDDIFLAIIAQYKRVAKLMDDYNETAQQLNASVTAQNQILETLDAFDVIEVSAQLDLIKEKVESIKLTAEDIFNREIILRGVSIRFVDGVCDIVHEGISEHNICDVYFDEYSYELASSALITATSYDGYLRIAASKQIEDELQANIIVRRY